MPAIRQGRRYGEPRFEAGDATLCRLDEIRLDKAERAVISLKIFASAGSTVEGVAKFVADMVPAMQRTTVVEAVRFQSMAVDVLDPASP